VETQTIKTYFAPPERADQTVILNTNDILQRAPFINDLLEAFPTMAVILNQERQVVFWNKKFDQLLVSLGQTKILGQRVGECIDCIHAHDMDAGCGTAEHCRTCGATIAMLNASKGKSNVQECRITITSGSEQESLDLRVYATPATVGSIPVTVFSLADISDEKRRRVLERLFFHDILNTASGVKSLSDLLNLVDEDEMREVIKDLIVVSDQLVDELISQRDLAAAENHELDVKQREVRVSDMLIHVRESYRFHTLAHEKFVETLPAPTDATLLTDPTLLSRVLGNLVKNALEASRKGETVVLSYAPGEDGGGMFMVNNPAVMPRDVQLQIFQRSFSTKGSGRGIGTYSIKLLTERYLGGKVSFTSTGEEGTTFFIELP